MVKRVLRKFRQYFTRSNEKLEAIRIAHAKTHQLVLSATLESTNICDYEYQVFSQWGDDGIIQYLINKVDVKRNTFIEFGVEDFTESNCRFLMVNNNWSGFVLDGNKDRVERIKRASYYWKYDLVAMGEFVTTQNINGLLSLSSFGDEPGIISIDIDGMDYWVFREIELRPFIFIIEYNSVLGRDRAITVPYDPQFNRTKSHYSNLYYGASLRALTDLAIEKGYSLVGSNSAGNNAYYVRNDALQAASIKACSVREAYVESKFREARDVRGRLTFERGNKRIEKIRGLPVVNTRNGDIEDL